MIEIDGLTKRYGDKAAVDGLSFVVEPGVVVVVIGLALGALLRRTAAGLSVFAAVFFVNSSWCARYTEQSCGECCSRIVLLVQVVLVQVVRSAMNTNSRPGRSGASRTSSTR